MEYKDIFGGLTEEQATALEAAFMSMEGYVWLLYEKENTWFIAVQHLDDLSKTLWTKIRVAGGYRDSMTADDLCIDFKETNFDETEKYKLLWLTERNREHFFEIFLGKYQPMESEEYKDYEMWVIKE